jgi:hypothetical protein
MPCSNIVLAQTPLVRFVVDLLYNKLYSCRAIPPLIHNFGQALKLIVQVQQIHSKSSKRSLSFGKQLATHFLDIRAFLAQALQLTINDCFPLMKGMKLSRPESNSIFVTSTLATQALK